MAEPIQYASDERRRPEGWWAPWVSAAVGTFGLIWMTVGWAGVLTSDQRSIDAAGILLGMLTAAVLPGSLVGIFLGVVSVQKLGGAFGWVVLALNLIVAAAGAAGLLWAVL